MSKGSRTLSLTLAVLAAGLATSAMGATPSPDDIFSAADGWTRVTDGVYERPEADGSVSRFAYGSGGAAYERSRLQGELAELSAQFPKSDADERALEQRIADVRTAIAAIPDKAGDGIVPMSTTTGRICGTWDYHWDYHFTVGDDGATAISRILLTANPLGPVVPAPAAVSQTATAIATKAGGSPSPVSNTGSTYKSTTSAVAEWDGTNIIGSINSASCTGSASFNLAVTPGFTCGGSPFASMSQSFPTCTTVP
jgi:hypothetical protein